MCRIFDPIIASVIIMDLADQQSNTSNCITRLFLLLILFVLVHDLKLSILHLSEPLNLKTITLIMVNIITYTASFFSFSIFFKTSFFHCSCVCMTTSKVKARFFASPLNANSLGPEPAGILYILNHSCVAYKIRIIFKINLGIFNF